MANPQLSAIPSTEDTRLQETWTPLLDLLPQGVLLADASGRYVEANQAAQRILGLDRATLLGSGLAEPRSQVVDVAGRQVPYDETPGAEAFRTGVAVPARAVGWVREQGDTLWLMLSATPVSGGGVLVSFEDITEQKRIEDALAAGESRLRSMLQTAMDGVWLVDLEGRFLEANEAACRMLGRSREELLGIRVAEIEARDSAEEIKARIERLVQSGWDLFETSHRRSDGTVFPVEISTTFLRDAAQLVVYVRDRTEHRVHLQALVDSEARYRMLAENAADVIWTLDLESRRFTYVSPSVFTLRGLTPEEVMAEPMAAAVTPASASRIQEVLEATFRNLRPDDPATWVAKTEVDQVRKDGSIVPTEVITRLIPDPQGGFRTVLGVSRNIEERRAAEAARLQLEAQMQRAQKLDSLGSLAGGVAHDMNNVLGAIMGLASLQEGLAPEGSALRRSMETVGKACQRGRSLVQGLLGFARQGLAEEKVLDLNELVLEQAELLGRTTLQKVGLDLDLQEGLHPISGDPSVLSQILMNLAVNAVDAMPEGGVLTFRTRNVGQGSVELEVRDTGVGMAPEVLAKATDPFFTTKPQGKGTGLGLSIVYGAVKAHRGRMEIHSAPGQGTAIRIVLEASAPAAVAGAAARKPDPVQPALRVLVVDDDDLFQASLASMLEGMGHAPLVAASGEEALRLLREGQACDVVVLDLNMPGLGGEATLPLLRLERPGLRVLLATGRTSQRALDLVARYPDVDLIAKPFSLDELRNSFARFAAQPG